MAVETQEMLEEAFRDNALGQTHTYKGFKHFRKRQLSVDDDKHSGKHLTGITNENVEKARQALLQDRRRMIHDISNTVGLSYGKCQCNLSDELNMRRIATKSVPRLMSKDQKQYRIAI
jgi:hypothetical protein